jgi:hypothetical protein
MLDGPRESLPLELSRALTDSKVRLIEVEVELGWPLKFGATFIVHCETVRVKHWIISSYHFNHNAVKSSPFAVSRYSPCIIP